MLKLEPLEPGGPNFEFVDAIKGGVVPREFIPAVQKGIEDTLPFCTNKRNLLYFNL